MSSGGKSNSAAAQPIGQQTIQQKSEPWEGQKPYLNQGMIQAEQLRSTPRNYYSGSTVVPFSNQTESAMQGVEDRARSGSELYRIGRSGMEATARGDFLNPESNPYLRKTYDAAARPMAETFRDATMPGISSGAIQAGRYGSGLMVDQQGKAMEGLSRGLGDLSATLYGQNYAQERDRMTQAQGMAPQYAQSDYDDLARLASVGGQREAKAGENLQDSINRFNFNEQEPWSRNADYMAMIGGNYGRTDTTTQPIYGAQSSGSTFGNVLSGMGGLGLLASGFGGLFREGGKVRKPANDRGAPPAPPVRANDDDPTVTRFASRARRHSFGAR